MGKRYFCDYCDRSFQDNLHNRKKHLNGVQHLRAKRVWYDLFRDAAAILQEEQTKKPCRKFLQTGQCDFGSNCRFSHMTEQDLEKLSAQVQGEKRLKELQREGADIPPGTIEDWLDKRAQRLSAAQSNRQDGIRKHQGWRTPGSAPLGTPNPSPLKEGRKEPRGSGQSGTPEPSPSRGSCRRDPSTAAAFPLIRHHQLRQPGSEQLFLKKKSKEASAPLLVP
ncbi:zinc finger matrin-type protein 5 isoform 2-T7 [Sylvia borin]